MAMEKKKKTKKENKTKQNISVILLRILPEGGQKSMQRVQPEVL